MTVLEFPNDKDLGMYAYHDGASFMGSSYFPINNMHGNYASSTSFIPSNISKYEYLRYIDLNQNLEGDTLPFINTGNPFTVEVKMTIHVDDANYFDKSRVFFSIGQFVAGKHGGIITVGTNANDPLNKNKPVLGLIDQNGVKKSVPISGTSMEISDSITSAGKEYSFRLIFNPNNSTSNRVTLFMSEGDGEEVLQSNGEGLSINHNYHITKPRVYLFTSGWTNEHGWDGNFDYAYGSVDTKDLKITDNVKYPVAYIVNNLKNVSYQAGSGQPNSINPSSPYVSSESYLQIYM